MVITTVYKGMKSTEQLWYEVVKLKYYFHRIALEVRIETKHELKEKTIYKGSFLTTKV